MPGETTQTGIDTGSVTTVDGAIPAYPRVTTDFYITQSVGITPGGTTRSITTYTNVIVTLSNVKVEDFAIVWDNLKINIINNIGTITT